MFYFEIMKYKLLLVEELVTKYYLDEDIARLIVENSTISKMMKKSPEFIIRYVVEDNAEEIYNEYMRIPMEM